MKQIVFFIIAFVLCCCSEKKQSIIEAKPTTTSNAQKDAQNKSKEELIGKSDLLKEENVIQEDTIAVGTFSSVPNEIDGCGCTFFLSEQDEQMQKFVYVDSGDMACVNVNGELQLLYFKEYNEETGIMLYSNKSIELRKESVKSVPNTEEETTNVEAVLIISTGTTKTILKVAGYCGC